MKGAVVELVTDDGRRGLPQSFLLEYSVTDGDQNVALIACWESVNGYRTWSVFNIVLAEKILVWSPEASLTYFLRYGIDEVAGVDVVVLHRPPVPNLVDGLVVEDPEVAANKIAIP